MKKILFPTEFSTHAGQSFLYALDLAKRNNASITLLHAYHVPINPEMSMNDIGNAAMQDLKAFTDENTPEKYEGVELHYLADMGAAVDAILSVAEDEEMDLIVMSMKGKTNALASYFGSITLDVVSRTIKPVFLVPSVNRFKPIEKMAFAFEMEMTDLLYLTYMHNFLDKLKAQMAAVHFTEQGASFQVAKTIDMLRDIFKYHPQYKAISFFMDKGEFETEIHQFVAEEDIDLLITHSIRKNWKFRFVEPSSSNKIARRINIPMLIMKE